MNLPWEREVRKTVRAAEALLEPPRFAWLEAVQAQDLLSPSEAMEHLFRQALGSNSQAGTNPDSQFNSHEPAGLPMLSSAKRLIEGSAAHIARAQALPAMVENPLHQALNNDPRADTHPDSGAGALKFFNSPRQPAAKELPDGSAARPTRSQAFPAPSATVKNSLRQALHDDPEVPSETRGLRMSTPARETRRDAVSFTTARYTSVTPAQKPLAGTNLRKPNPAFRNLESSMTGSISPHKTRQGARRPDEVIPSIPASPEQHGIRQQWNDGASAAVETRPSAISGSEANTPQSTRMVTRFSDLQGLFQSMVEGSQSGAKNLPAGVAPPPTVTRTDAAPAPLASPPSSHRKPAQQRMAGWPVDVGAFTTRCPSAGDAAPLIPDLAWEELWLDRLLDRWEERLREQAIRHLGFTGGLT